jgi:hypothetical protein
MAMMYELNWCDIYMPIWLVCLILGGQKTTFVGLQSNITFAVVLVRDAHQSFDMLPIWQRGRAPCRPHYFIPGRRHSN